MRVKFIKNGIREKQCDVINYYSFSFVCVSSSLSFLSYNIFIRSTFLFFRFLQSDLSMLTSVFTWTTSSH